MRLIACFLLSMLWLPVFAQQKTVDIRPPYPQDYFRNPLDIPIFLAGNFGECRPGHFHSGVDIKTLGEENQPVHAAADGYISRIKMDKGGFGHALYITHPNGYTTLYAHLNKFAPAIQAYLEKEQYAKRHWDVDVQLSPEQFPVKKGQKIAYSGNTGASTAPHLHFEIRNTQTEHPLNPELFGLPIIDKTPPVPTEIVFYFGNIYDRCSLSATLAKKGSIYKPIKTDNVDLPVHNDTVSVCNAITGIGVNVNDFMDGSDNTIAFYNMKLFMDDSIQSEVTLDNIGYDETRYINAYADYLRKQVDNKWVQCLFKLPGNHLESIFSNLNVNNGKLDLTDKTPHKIRIVITDDKSNKTEIAFYVNPDGIAFYPPKNDCRRFAVNKVNEFNSPNVVFTFDGRELYDDICFQFKTIPAKETYSDKYQLHYSYIPVHHYFELKIKPTKSVPERLSNKMVMLYTDDKDTDGRAAAATDNGWYQAKVRNFGTYWLDTDTIPPVIKPLQKNNSNLSKAKQIAFEVKDEMTSVKTFSGYLDGKWICFEQHNDLFFYNFDGHCSRGKHSLVFKAEDENGNVQTAHLNFTR